MSFELERATVSENCKCILFFLIAGIIIIFFSAAINLYFFPSLSTLMACFCMVCFFYSVMLPTRNIEDIVAALDENIAAQETIPPTFEPIYQFEG